MKPKGEYASRNAILGLLTEAEVAKVSTREGLPKLVEGDEFIDLEHLEHGVRQVHAKTDPIMGQVLPRSAVSDKTWKKIISELTH